MKTWVWILVLLNIGIWTFFNQDLFYPVPATHARAEIEPEKLNVLSAEQLNQMPKNNLTPSQEVSTAEPLVSNSATTTEKTACYEWGLFSNQDIDEAQTKSSQLSLQATLKEQSASEAKRYWVYMPKLKNAQAAQDKLDELRTLGVNDMYVMQDEKWKNAISFGIFEDEQLATILFNALQEKGIKNIQKEFRNQGKKHFSLFIKNALPSDIERLKETKSEFPDALIKEISCG